VLCPWPPCSAGPGKGWRVSEGRSVTRNHGGHPTHSLTALWLSAHTVFGVAAAWLIAKYRFSGRNLLITLIDLPLCVAGYLGPDFVLLFGSQGLCGQWLPTTTSRSSSPRRHRAGHRLCHLPLRRARCLPALQAAACRGGSSADLGASGCGCSFGVTCQDSLGSILRLILLQRTRHGEFGAVSVVSGHIRGVTNTARCKSESPTTNTTRGAFAVASLLTWSPSPPGGQEGR